MSKNRLPYLFTKSQKTSFKERCFVFNGEAPNPTAGENPGNQREAIVEVSSNHRQVEGTKAAKLLLQEDYQLNEDLEFLNQNLFDKIVKERLGERKPGLSKTELNREQIGKLVKFAKLDRDNLRTLFTEFQAKRITVDQLNMESTAAFINLVKDKPEDLAILVDAFVNTPETTNTLIYAIETNPELTNQAYEKIKDKPSILQGLTTIALIKLANFVNAKNFYDLIDNKVDDNRKSAMFKDDTFSGKRATIILNGIVQKGLNKLDASDLENIVTYICKKEPDQTFKILHEEFSGKPNSQSNAAKLTASAAKALLEKIAPAHKMENPEATKIFNNILKNLSAKNKETLLADNTLTPEISQALKENQPAAANGTEPEVEKTAATQSTEASQIPGGPPVEAPPDTEPAEPTREGSRTPRRGPDTATTPFEKVENIAESLKILASLGIKIKGFSEQDDMLTNEEFTQLQKIGEWIKASILQNKTPNQILAEFESTKDKELDKLFQNTNISFIDFKTGEGDADTYNWAQHDVDEPPELDDETSTAPTDQKAAVAPTTQLTQPKPEPEPAKPQAEAKPAEANPPAEPEPTETPEPAEETLTAQQTTEQLEALKAEGLEIVNGPEILTRKAATALVTSLNSYIYALRNAADAYKIIATLKIIGINLSKQPFLHTAQIKFIDNSLNMSLTWSAADDTPENGFGFGKTDYLIDRILEIKATEFEGRDTPAYLEFLNETRKARTEARKEDYEKRKWQDYANKYKELTSKVYTLDHAIGDMYEGDIAVNWGNYENHGLVESIMNQPPFGVSSQLAGTLATKIITEGNNDRIYFNDIFKFANQYPGFKAIIGEGKISAESLQDGDKIMAEFEKLIKLGQDTEAYTEAHKKALYIFEKIIVPVFKLLEAISHLRFDEKREGPVTQKDPLEVAKKSLPEGQLPIIDSLQKLLNYSEDPADSWQELLGLLGGAETITMANMDGTTFDVDQGMFSRHFDPKAALFILLEKPHLYTIKNGKKSINEPALLQEINELMQRGYAIRELQKAKAAKEPLTPGQIKSIQEGAKQYSIINLQGTDFTEDQMMAFQLGFLNKEIEESENTVEKEVNSYLTSIFKEKPLSTGENKTFKEMLKQGNPRDAVILQEIRDKLKGFPQAVKDEAEAMKNSGRSKNVVHGHVQLDKNGNVVAGSVAGSFKLSNGATMTVGLIIGKSTPGKFAPAAAYSCQIDGGDGWSFNFNAGVTISGAFAGVSGNIDAGKGIDVDWMLGVSASWWSIVDLGVGAGIGVSWDRAVIKSERDAAQETTAKEAGLTKEDLTNWPKMSTEEKMDFLQKSHEWQSIKAVQDALPAYLNNENLVRIYDGYIAKLKGQADSKAEKPLYFPVPTGIGIAGAIPAAIALATGGGALLALGIAAIAGAKFRIGTVEIFIPHPKEEQRILESTTDANVRAKISELFAKMKTGEEKVIFEETTPDVYYRPGSGLGKGIRIDNKEIDLSQLHNDIGIYNKALEEGGTETRLIKRTDGKIELALDNLFNKENEADKDLEVHIDPNLASLAVIHDGGKIFLEGNIDDLVITRERFRFSRFQNEGRSSIRDVVTIRQSSSVSGKRQIDRSWLQENEQSYLEILMGKEKFKTQAGGGYIGSLQDNIREVEGFAARADWLQREELGGNFSKHFHQYRPEAMKVGNEGKIIDETKANAMMNDIRAMHDTLGVMTKIDFEREQPRAGFNEKIRTLFIDPDFQNEYIARFDSTDPSALIKLPEWLNWYTTQDNSFELDNLTPKELALAENMLRDLWFTTAYRSEGALKELTLSAAINNKLRKAGFKNIRNLDILTATELLEKGRKVGLTDSEATEIVNAVKIFKEKPLSNAQLIEKNRQLKRRIESVRDYTTSKYIEEFNRVIPSMDPKLSNTNAKDLVENHFMKGIYDNLLKALDNKNPPILDFRKIDLEKIPTGADLVSGTRWKYDGQNVKTLSHTLFEKTAKSDGQLHLSGFLKIATKEYSLAETGVERDIARILLELGDKVPAYDISLLKSNFAIKVLGLGAYRLIAGEENYKLMTELVRDPIKFNEEKYKEAFTQFKDLVLTLRQSQHVNKIHETVSAETGSKITIDMVSDTKIVAGAYTQCTNPSFYVSGNGKAKVTGKTITVIGASNQITQVSDAETDLAGVTFSLSGGVGIKRDKEEEPTPPTEEPAAGGGGEVGQVQPVDSQGGATIAPPQPAAGNAPSDI